MTVAGFLMCRARQHKKFQMLQLQQADDLQVSSSVRLHLYRPVHSLTAEQSVSCRQLEVLAQQPLSTS